jgi:hypothetical protein
VVFVSYFRDSNVRSLYRYQINVFIVIIFCSPQIKVSTKYSCRHYKVFLVRTFIHTYIHTYIHTHTHTYTLTYVQSSLHIRSRAPNITVTNFFEKLPPMHLHELHATSQLLTHSHFAVGCLNLPRSSASLYFCIFLIQVQPKRHIIDVNHVSGSVKTTKRGKSNKKYIKRDIIHLSGSVT